MIGKEEEIVCIDKFRFLDKIFLLWLIYLIIIIVC